jgi:hypothetical protein
MAYRRLLTTGAVMKKHKHGRGSNRLIWVTPLLDHVVWSDDAKLEIKGFLLTKDMKKVTRGVENKMYKVLVVAADRDLELEAKTAAMMDEWADAFDWLMTVCYTCVVDPALAPVYC